MNETDLELLKPQLQLYRGSFLLIEFLFLIGLNMYCFSTSEINHSLIFGLDPRDHLSCYHIFEVSCAMMFLFVFSNIVMTVLRPYVFDCTADGRGSDCVLVHHCSG